jgi:hypothetical protein
LRLLVSAAISRSLRTSSGSPSASGTTTGSTVSAHEPRTSLSEAPSRPPATSGACIRAAGADAALLELLGDRGCPVIDRLPVAVVALAGMGHAHRRSLAKPSLRMSSVLANSLSSRAWGGLDQPLDMRGAHGVGVVADRGSLTIEPLANSKVGARQPCRDVDRCSGHNYSMAMANVLHCRRGRPWGSASNTWIQT